MREVLARGGVPSSRGRGNRTDVRALEVDKPGSELPLCLFAGLGKFLLSESRFPRHNNTYFKEGPWGVNETHQKVAGQAGGHLGIHPSLPTLTETKN